MPNYKTHSIHIEKVLPYIDKRIELDKEDLKIFSFGPDSLALLDSKTFNAQHLNKAKAFFEHLIRTIKIARLRENKEMIAFLYGQLEHYALDTTFHPYINYVMPYIPNNYMVNPHSTFELWLDDYFANKYNVKEKKYYSKKGIKHKYVRALIDYVYKKVYKCHYASNKYDAGINAFIALENARKSDDKIIPTLSKTFGISDIAYDDVNRIKPFLNTDRDSWYNPFSLEEHHESLNELWNKSVELYMQIIEDVNKYLYDGKELKNSLIDNDLSYDTGLNSQSIILTKNINKEVQS